MSLYDSFSEQERQILQERAARVAGGSARQDERADGAVAALRVTVCGESYALPLESITAVYDRTPIIPVPCTPPFVAGIANIRGHIIPVLDLAALLGISGEGAPHSAALVVVENEDLTVAFCIEQVGEVATLATGSLSEIPAGVELAQTAYLLGAMPDGTILLDIKAVLNDPRIDVEQAAA